MSDPVVLRDARESDDGFIVDAWTENFKPHSMTCRVAGVDPYRRMMQNLIRRIGDEPGAKRIIAADATDTWQIAGFLIATGQELHYVFVRESLRGHGIAKQMLQAVDIKSHTFSTPEFKKRIKPRDRGWEFRPRFTL
jgi:GNAT superfamily N-acetyltransferase